MKLRKLKYYNEVDAGGSTEQPQGTQEEQGTDDILNEAIPEETFENTEVNVVDEQLEEEQEIEEPIEDEFLVDDDLINDYPSLKMFKGKNISEVLTSFEEQRKTITQVTQERSELTKRLDQIEEKISKPVEKPQEKQREEALPDPMDDLEGYTKRVIEMAQKPLLEKLNGFETKTQEAQLNQNKQTFVKTLKDSLPEGVSEQEAIGMYATANQEFLLDNTGQLDQSVYSKLMSNPVQFAAKVAELVKASTPQKNIKVTQEAEKIKKIIKNSNAKVEGQKKRIIKNKKVSDPNFDILNEAIPENEFKENNY